MSFTLVINNSNVNNTNTNSSHTYNFIGGGFTVPDDMEVTLSSAQISPRARWVPLGEVLGYLVGYRSSRAEAWGTQGLGSRTSRTVKIWDLVVLGDVPLELGPLDGT